jgi:hypothetical protein
VHIFNATCRLNRNRKLFLAQSKQHEVAHACLYLPNKTIVQHNSTRSAQRPPPAQNFTKSCSSSTEHSCAHSQAILTASRFMSWVAIRFLTWRSGLPEFLESSFRTSSKPTALPCAAEHASRMACSFESWAAKSVRS